MSTDAAGQTASSGNMTGLDRRKLHFALTALAIAIAIILPFVVSPYTTLQLTYVVIYAIALLGLNMLIGFNGQLSLGHGAFFGIGAYTAAILIIHAGMPYWLTLPFAAAICLLGGFLFGLPALRLEGHYLALATFALALAMPQILKHPLLEHWTGLSMGVSLPPISAPKGIPVNSDQYIYFFCLAWALVIFLIGWNMLRGRTGRAMVALRDHPIAASTMGINAAFYKSMTFGVSAMYAGLAGALFALTSAYVAPDSFDFFLSISLVVGIIIGGITTISGAIFGAIFIQFVPNIAGDISKSAPWAVYGVTLIIFMYLMPTGVVGMLKRVFDLVVKPRST
jgi:branched-chain amino acid transport system permease protein